MSTTAKLPTRLRTRRLTIAVLMGGVSSEREVSLRSGKAVVAGLTKRGHEVHAIDVTSDGPGALDAIPDDVDAVFLALHGRFGEDGEVQRRLEARGISYIGSDANASARAFDKAWTKTILAAKGIPVAPDVTLEFPFRAKDVKRAIRSAPAAEGPGPCLVVKPVREGSSVGVTICQRRAQASRALWKARSFRQPVVVERFVPGREVTIAIFDDEALPPIEVVPALAFYDYKATYDPTSGTKYRVAPDDFPAGVLERAKAAALGAHRALGCRDVSRVDVRITPAGEVFVLEVNTIPGLTATSLLPKAAAAAGIGFEELCERLVRRAVARATSGERVL